MPERKVHKTRCMDCPAHIPSARRDSPSIGGVQLIVGQRYCTGKKKPRQFRPRDPKTYPPSWCPGLKNPAEYRVYAYKDSQTWVLQRMLRSDGIPSSPSGHNYAVRASGHIDLTARSFWEQLEDTSASKLLGVSVHTDEVVEIDDGIKPCFFHICEDGARVIPLFDAERAKKNKYEADNHEG